MSNEVTLDSLPKGTVPLEIPPSGQFQLALEQAENVYNSAIDLNGEINTTKNTITNIQNDITNKQQLIESYKNDTEAKANEALASANLAKEYMENAFSATPTGYEQLIEKVDNQSSENVKQNDEIALLKRKVSAQEQINKDIAYRFETDDTEAYQKVIRSGAKAFDLKILGGKSVVVNQLVDWNKQTFTSYDSTKTIDRENRTIRLIGNVPSVKYVYINCNGLICNLQHKYLLKTKFTNTLNIPLTSVWGKANNTESGSKGYTLYNGEYWQISTPQQTDVAGTYLFGCTFNTSVGTEFDVTFSDVQEIDLTQMFGAGNEPTLEECQQIFTDFIPYNKGEIVSASVGNVKVQGKNLLNVAFKNKTNTVDTNKPSDYVYSNGLMTEDVIEVNPNTQYTYSLGLPFTISSLTVFEYDSNDEFITKFAKYNQNFNTITTNANTKFIRLGLYRGSAITPKDIEWVQFERGTVATSFSPYTEQNITIPNECVNLHSAGTVHDSIEMYEENGKKYIKKIQRVGSVDLGTLSWGRYSTTTDRFVATFSLANSYSNAICSKIAVTGTWNIFLDNVNSIYVNVAYNQLLIHSTYDATTQLTEFRQSLQGVILYYELKTPVETIYEIDNRFDSITCEANGTITFEGADSNYHLPVPNEEEFMVKLSEV